VKELLRSHSLSYVQGLQLALEAEGIKAVLLDAQAPGYIGFAGRVRLAVARDVDYERAIEVVRALEPPSSRAEVPASWRLQRWGLAGLIAGVVMLGVGGAVAETAPRPVAYGLFVVAAGLLIFGMALVMLGPRRDRQKPH
jgi:Putative prokaryotic signal transducing protein